MQITARKANSWINTNLSLENENKELTVGGNKTEANAKTTSVTRCIIPHAGLETRNKNTRRRKIRR